MKRSPVYHRYYQHGWDAFHNGDSSAYLLHPQIPVALVRYGPGDRRAIDAIHGFQDGYTEATEEYASQLIIKWDTETY